MSLVKLVITDIDNTIVPKHKSLSQRALKCIHQLKDKGIYFGLASGRTVEEIRRIIKRWHLQNVDCIVYLNGCGLYDALSDKKYEYYKMKKEWIKETLEFMKQFDANPIMYYKDHLLTKRLDSIVQMSAQSAEMDIMLAQSDEDFYRDEAAKIMYRVKPETMPVIEKYLMENPSNHYIGYKTQNTLIEFSDQRVSKAGALSSFCHKHNIEMKDVVAFGDTTNDNSMLQVSGLGVCMLNGSEDTKCISDRITNKTCDEDGWADFVELNILK